MELKIMSYNVLHCENYITKKIDFDAFAKVIKESGAEAEIIFANDPRAILPYTKNVLFCDIHTRKRTKRLLAAAGAEKLYGLDEILNASVNGSGYNENYGLLGSNKSTEDKIKLFPRECKPLVLDIQDRVLKATGKHVEVMVYGDGAFKDPQGKIWELADPCVSPGYTKGLEGTPNELKLKYLADNDFKDLSGDELKSILKNAEEEKPRELNKKGSITDVDYISEYSAMLRDMIKEEVGAKDYDYPLKEFKIAVDAGNGVGGFYIKDVLEPLGADTSGSVAVSPNGHFPTHQPNPENKAAMESISQATVNANADLGIIFDTDCDRSACVDSEGEPINRNK